MFSQTRGETADNAGKKKKDKEKERNKQGQDSGTRRIKELGIQGL